jgi:hypothetical protein
MVDWVCNMYEGASMYTKFWFKNPKEQDNLFKTYA